MKFATLSSAVVLVFVTTSVTAQRTRAVAPPRPAAPAVPSIALDCKPTALPPAEADRCRKARHDEGQRLFESETFGGNGRTCETCHSKATGTFSDEDVRVRLAANPADPLFVHDALDDGNSGTSMIRSRATIRVTLPLPPHLRLADDPGAFEVTFRRATPTTKNTPALDKHLMSDFRESSLEMQAAGAIHGHAQSRIDPTPLQLELIAEFEKSDARFFSDERLMTFATKGLEPTLPLGNTDSEKRGRLFFEDQPISRNSMAGACAVCHSGPMLNETNRFASQVLRGIPKGMRIQSAGVSERNKLNNPIYKFEIRDGSQISIVFSPDPGLLMSDPSSPAIAAELAALGPNTRVTQLTNRFKIPTLWGVKQTAPYFHDNSAKDFDELLEHYNFLFESLGAGPEALKPQDIIDIKAFLNLL